MEESNSGRWRGVNIDDHERSRALAKRALRCRQRSNDAGGALGRGLPQERTESRRERAVFLDEEDITCCADRTWGWGEHE